MVSARTALWLGALSLCFVTPTSLSQAQREAAHELRFATLAPEGSPWMRSLRRWDRALREETGGRVGLRIYPGCAQGQEPMVIDKMAAGQLDGAALTTTGLSQIVRPVLVLGLASVIGDYEALDRVRRHMGPRFHAYFEREGYSLSSYAREARAEESSPTLTLESHPRTRRR